MTVGGSGSSAAAAGSGVRASNGTVGGSRLRVAAVSSCRGIGVGVTGAGVGGDATGSGARVTAGWAAVLSDIG